MKEVRDGASLEFMDCETLLSGTALPMLKGVAGCELLGSEITM